jgi:hypothetical protein
LCVAGPYGVTAAQATWGGPPWWPVAVRAAGVTDCSVLGFALGSFLPGRFTAPLVALGAFLALLVGFHLAVRATSGYSPISPVSPARRPCSRPAEWAREIRMPPNRLDRQPLLV